MEPSNSKEIRRVPKALSADYNIETATRLYDMGGSVMFDIVIFLANYKLKDLFGNNWFSITDFCNYMGYDRTTLQRKLSEEQRKELLGNTKAVYRTTAEDGSSITHPIETYFEAALYKLGKENLAFPIQNRDGSTTYQFLQIVERFDIKFDFKSRKKTRRLYNAVLGVKILDSLLNEYNLMDLSDYRQIPDRTGYRRFYLNLCKMISLVKYRITTGQAPYFKLTVDQLANIFDINTSENRKRKQKVTELLNNINNILKVSKFKFQYIRDQGRWAYTVQFYFPQETLDYFDEKYKAVFTSKYYTCASELFFELKKGVLRSNIYKWTSQLKTDPILNKEFTEWLYSQENVEEKLKLYRESFYLAFKKYPEDFDGDWDNIIL